MKRICISFLAVCFILLLTQCKKSNDSPATKPAPINPIVGLWIGSQIPGDNSTIVPLYYSFDIKSDSTLLVQGAGADGNTYYSVGKWSLTGTAFAATITVSNYSQAGVKQNLTAVYDSTLGKLKSGVVQTVGVNYSASFSLDRIN